VSFNNDCDRTIFKIITTFTTALTQYLSRCKEIKEIKSFVSDSRIRRDLFEIFFSCDSYSGRRIHNTNSLTDPNESRQLVFPTDLRAEVINHAGRRFLFLFFFFCRPKFPPLPFCPDIWNFFYTLRLFRKIFRNSQ